MTEEYYIEQDGMWLLIKHRPTGVIVGRSSGKESAESILSQLNGRGWVEDCGDYAQV